MQDTPSLNSSGSSPKTATGDQENQVAKQELLAIFESTRLTVNRNTRQNRRLQEAIAGYVIRRIRCLLYKRGIIGLTDATFKLYPLQNWTVKACMNELFYDKLKSMQLESPSFGLKNFTMSWLTSTQSFREVHRQLGKWASEHQNNRNWGNLMMVYPNLTQIVRSETKTWIDVELVFFYTMIAEATSDLRHLELELCPTTKFDLF